jgi:hypothetical protein
MPPTGFVKSHQLATDLLVGQEQTGIHVLTHMRTDTEVSCKRKSPFLGKDSSLKINITA